jgi:hypothetical protein
LSSLLSKLFPVGGFEDDLKGQGHVQGHFSPRFPSNFWGNVDKDRGEGGPEGRAQAPEPGRRNSVLAVGSGKEYLRGRSGYELVISGVQILRRHLVEVIVAVRRWLREFEYSSTW